MQKLIDAYLKAATPANRAKLAAYIAKHPMALCMVGPETIAFLRDCGFTV